MGPEEVLEDKTVVKNIAGLSLTNFYMESAGQGIRDKSRRICRLSSSVSANTQTHLFIGGKVTLVWRKNVILGIKVAYLHVYSHLGL